MGSSGSTLVAVFLFIPGPLKYDLLEIYRLIKTNIYLYKSIISHSSYLYL